MSTTREDCAAAAQLVAAVHAQDVARVIRILDGAAAAGRLRELACAAASQAASTSDELLWAGGNVQLVLDEWAMAMMPEGGPQGG